MEKNKEKYLLKTDKMIRKRAAKMRKKLNIKPKQSEEKKVDYDQEEEYSLVKRIENGDESAVKALRRLQRRRGK